MLNKGKTCACVLFHFFLFFFLFN
ncbi:hypothetical protein NC651_014121 [Populus alba x Populus x berolinensis]|nr:hypothetical protein NC651_014121 [Populus alba x Populus x berolinensis]